MSKIDAIRIAAGLSVAELALWLDTPWSTTNLWCSQGREPAIYKRLQVEAGLEKLRAVTGRGRPFPVPLSIAQRDRRGYVLGVKKRL